MSPSLLRCALVLGFIALAFPARAQEPLPVHAGVHVLTVGPSGELACDVATEAQVRHLHDTAARSTGQRLALTPLPSLNAEGVSDFRIVLRATDQLLARPEALLAFRRSAARWERIIQDAVTTVIDVDYGPERFGTPYGSNILGSTSSALFFAGSTSGTADMVARLKGSTSDPQLLALYDAIPVPTPSTSSLGNLNRGIGGLIPLQVLGYQPATTNLLAPFGDVPSIGFNDAFPYDFDPTDGVDDNLTDFEGVAIHEIGHALGFTSAIGISASGSDPLFTPWDLFRVRPEAVSPGESLTNGAGFETTERVVTPGPPNTEVLVVENGQTYYAPVQVFFDGLMEYEVSTATGAGTGGDGQQASHWRDDALRPPSLGADRKIGIMDPNLGRGTRDELSEADIRMLEVIGFSVDYNPPAATVALSIAGQAVEEGFLITDPISVGDAPSGMTFEVPVVIANEDADTALDYELEVELTDVFPASVHPTLSFSAADGTVEPAGSSTLQLRISGVDEQALGAGLVRLRTNDDDRPVIEVPITFTVGGAVAPTLAVGGVPDALGDLNEDEVRTATIALSNAGTFDLSYRVLTTLVTRGFEFPETSAARSAAPVFSADFEGANPLVGFQYNSKATPDRWQTRTTGPATLPGHSSPTVLYYGDVGGGHEYSDNTLGQIRTPAIDFSGAAPGSRVTLSFANYLQAEAGFDFATVLVSVDGGLSYETIASSDGGVLRNTEEWETVTLEVPGLAGFPTPVYFAFRFDSDASVTDDGWYLDDIVVDVAEGEAPFFATPVAGTIPGEGSTDLTLTVDASVLDAGFYRGALEIRTDQPGDDPAPYLVEFTVGDPALPTIVPVDAAPTLSTPGDALGEAVLRLRNGGDATLSYVRVLEPAASRFEGAAGRVDLGHAAFEGLAGPDAVIAHDEAARTGAVRMDDGDVIAAVSFGTTPRFYDVAQLPDGRVVLFDGASRTSTTALVLPRDLSDPGDSFSTGDLDATVTGVAYNEQTESLWITTFEGAQLVEVTLDAGSIIPTGREAYLDFTPFGMDYSPELDAFLVGSYQTDGLLAVTAAGDLLPGYPAFVVGREDEADATATPGVSFYQGLLEMTGQQDELLQRGQFGAGFSGQAGGAFSEEVLAGATGVYALLRDRLDPNGSFYVTTRPASGTPARLVRLDPPDLPAGVGTRVRAAEPIFADRSVDPRASFDVFLELDGRGLPSGPVADEIAFLTNNPTDPLVRIPLTLSVTPVSNEGAEAGAFAFSGVQPNPVRGAGRVQFELAGPADVSVAVFDVLGRRVAILAERAPMAAGAHDLAFLTSGLAPGVYVVRIEAGAEGGARKVTVIR